jgi:acrylyl-CoA reductase (NADPH)
MPRDKLEAMTTLKGLGDLPTLGEEILQGKIKGRAVIDVNA